MFAACRAGDQVRNSVAYPKLNVKIAATHGGISTGGDGASHQANEDIAVMRSFPNMTVLVPGDYEEARLATAAAAEFIGPVYLRFGRDKYPVVDEIHGEFCIGRAKTIRDGADITIITTGIMVSEALRAAAELETSGLSVRVIHMPTMKPIDEEAILKAARETRGIGRGALDFWWPWRGRRWLCVGFLPKASTPGWHPRRLRRIRHRGGVAHVIRTPRLEHCG
jgi:transketolase